jgi:hypothetical protein
MSKFLKNFAEAFLYSTFDMGCAALLGAVLRDAVGVPASGAMDTRASNVSLSETFEARPLRRDRRFGVLRRASATEPYKTVGIRIHLGRGLAPAVTSHFKQPRRVMKPRASNVSLSETFEARPLRKALESCCRGELRIMRITNRPRRDVGIPPYRRNDEGVVPYNN